MTKDATGFRLAVLVIRRMPFDSRTLSARAEAYARRVFSSWAMTSNCGASVLLFVAIDDRRMYIQTGTLATQYLNTHQIDDVFGRMNPYLRKSQVFPALKAAIDRIGYYLSQYHGRSPPAVNTYGNNRNDPLFFKGGPAWWDLEMSIVVIIILVFLVCACCNGLGGPAASQRKRERREVLRKLEVVRMEYKNATNAHYSPMTCPVCQDDLGRPFSPTVPSLPSMDAEKMTLTGNGDSHSSTEVDRPIRSLRCGMKFHEDCFNAAAMGKEDGECPVCADRAGGVSLPPPLSELRMQDFAFRLRCLQQEFPRLLSEPVIQKLTALTPDRWPETLTDSFLEGGLESHGSRSVRYGGDGRGYVGEDGYSENGGYGMGGSGGGGGASGMLGTVGGLLAAGGVGALIGSALAGNNSGNDNNNNNNGGDFRGGYSNIGSDNSPPWLRGMGGGGGSGAGAGWIAANRNDGGGAGWGVDDGGNGAGAGWNVDDGGNGAGAGWDAGGDGGNGGGGDDGGGAGF